MNMVVRKILLLSTVALLSGCSGFARTNSSETSTSTVDNLVLSGIEFNDTVGFPAGVKVSERLHVKMKLLYGERSEDYVYSSFIDNSKDFTFKLFKGDSTKNVINKELVSGEKYTLEATYEGFTAKTEFTCDENVALLKSEDLEITYSDVDSDASPAIGNVKMLVIPINLYGSWTDTFTTEYLSLMNELYFGDDPLSLASYYRDASFGQMNISGMVSKIYNASSSYSTDVIQENSDGYSYLAAVMRNALTYVEEQYPEVDWKEYDLNGDKAIDNIHIVTNFNPETYQYSTGKQVWATNLWPHKNTLDYTDGTLENPTLRTYSCGVLSHLIENGGSAITPIHEQGHIFGLPDYYDYGMTIDYIGSYDMQSNNVLDWNAYSKLSVGWTGAYVVKDDCVITIDSASQGGIPLIIPADYETFNNSAFDEYFLIELFTKHGNNAKFPDIWDNIFDDEDGFGARLYHVDGRLITLAGKTTDNPDAGAQYIDNNCYATTSATYSGYPALKKYADYKLLTLIQKGGEDTFGDEEDPYARRYLAEEDLFKAGDTFKFEDYSHFLSKQHKEKVYMDNSEEFPYTIKFIRMDENSTTIRISSK